MPRIPRWHNTLEPTVKNRPECTRVLAVRIYSWPQRSRRPLPVAATGQTGKIVGRVVDGHTAQPISSAQIFLGDQSIGSLSAIDGRFVLRNVPPGTHDIVVQMIGYAAKTVTGVTVDPAGVASLDVALEHSAVALEGITVEAAVETGVHLGTAERTSGGILCG